MLEDFPTGGLVLALCLLTTYRISRLLAVDTFPPAAWFRDKIAAKFGEFSTWSYLVECMHCNSWWVALAVLGSAWLWHEEPLWVFITLGFSISAIVGIFADNLIPD